jgi:flavin-dependent dehydrogenase
VADRPDRPSRRCSPSEAGAWSWSRRTGIRASISASPSCRSTHRYSTGSALGARHLAGKADGNISIFWFDHGWFWLIPLADGTTSVGAVCPPAYIKSRKTDLTDFFMSAVALCPELAERLKGARLVAPFTATGNYSYNAERMTGRSFILVGDAFAFIDPVFSTGVYLAMTMAFLGADAVEACLSAPRSAARSLRRYETRARSGLAAFTWYIYRIREPAFRNLFMLPRNYLRIEEAVLSLPAGDIFGRSPIGLRLACFKILYCATKLFQLRSGFRAWRMPRRNAGLEATR